MSRIAILAFVCGSWIVFFMTVDIAFGIFSNAYGSAAYAIMTAIVAVFFVVAMSALFADGGR